MKKEGTAKTFLSIAIALLVISVVLSVVSLYPVATSKTQTSTIINDQFKLCPNETYRQGLGEFHGGENITIKVDCQTTFLKNFSIVTYNGQRYFNNTTADICHSFVAGTDYYEAIFTSNAPSSNWINFQVTVEKTKNLYPLFWVTEPAKIMFILSLASFVLIILKQQKVSLTRILPNNQVSNTLSRTFHSRLLALLVLSLVFWLALIALNSNGLASFENWYTDHVRHAYVSTLFIKDGLSIFSQPLSSLASQDNSRFMFVTWPEMPHLYPFGSMLVFFPFGTMLQSGFDSTLVYKLEIALFLFVAHICLYMFLKVFLKKDLLLTWKMVGIYVIYVSLVIYAADGMYDSVAFFFALIAIGMFLAERYDKFFLVMGISAFLKYQAGIFLLPFIIISIVKLLEKNSLKTLLKNKLVVGGAVFGLINLFTATLSLPMLMQTRPELIMNGINAFASNAQIPWSLQAFSIILTLAVTLTYSVYMRDKNSLLSLSSIFLLLPSFLLPYFQNWYLPFIFVYILIPQQKKELEVTLVWLVFVTAVLSFGGASFNPMQLLDNFRTLIRI